MPLFEVFIPAADPEGFDVTARVRADSWIAALRSGLAKLGDAADVRNVMVDIKEDSYDVTEPNSGRVFRIRELEDPKATPVAAPPPTPAAAVTAPAAAATPQVPPTPPPSASPAQPPAVTAARPPPMRGAPPPAVKPSTASSPETPRPVVAAKRPTTAAAAAAAAERRPAVTGPRFVAQGQEEEVSRQKPAAVAPAIGRARQKADQSAEDLIGELFEITQTVYEQPNATSAASFILDLAMRSIAADSGAVFISDINASDLFFAAARGPKAKEAMKFRVPMGQGIVGFCAQEGVALAVSDVHRDPRFYATVSKSIGYETKSILCCPAQMEGRVFGAIELINKAQGTSFSSGDVHVVNFLAHEFAEYLVNTGQTGN